MWHMSFTKDSLTEIFLLEYTAGRRSSYGKGRYFHHLVEQSLWATTSLSNSRASQSLRLPDHHPVLSTNQDAKYSTTKRVSRNL